MVVLDLDVLDLPPRLAEADRCAGALVLLRIAGRPSGQAVLSFAGWSHERPLVEILMEHACAAFWEAWLAYRLGLDRGPEPLPSLAGVDVVVCTRDRPDDLRKCLTDLLAMRQEGQRLLVVDNASRTDETRQVVEAFPGVRYAREDRPGLDIARNTGIRAAEGEIVAFIDDDAAPDPQWLRRLCRNFANPAVMAVGGLTMAMELATDAQIEFERAGGFARGFRRVVYDAGNCRSFDAWSAGAGVNMALRRCIVEEIGWFDEALDAGTMTLAGGDADYFRRIIDAGWRIVYDPEALNWHRHRRTMGELAQQIFGYEVSNFAIITKALFHERDIRALGAIARWLRTRGQQVRGLRARRAAGVPFDPLMPQLRGALAGPLRYRAQVRKAARGE